MNIIYLACGRARLNCIGHNIFYNDLIEPCDFMCDMLSIDLSKYDFILASPPCNFYSRANYRRDSSQYSLITKHLLPDIIDKCIKLNKPFVIENVRNYKLMSKLGLFDKNCFVYFHGRHTYWTNLFLNFSHIPQTFDFVHRPNGTYRLSNYVQGGKNVNSVFEYIINNFKFIGGTYV